MKQKKIYTRMVFVVFIIIALIQVYPLIYLFDFSLLQNNDFYVSGIFKIPDPPQWINYAKAWITGNVPKFMFNSLVVCVVSIAATLFLVLTMSYIFVKMEWKGRKFFFWMMLLGMMIPPHTTLIANYSLYETMGIRDTYFSMIIPYIAFNVPFGLFLMAGYLKTIPTSMIESAQIDGCGVFKTIFAIIGPLTKPALSSIGITTFINCWNEYVMASTFLSKDTYKTLPLSITKFTSEHGADLAAQFAVMAIVAIPAIVIYVLFSEKITEGIMAGAVKG